MVEAKQMKRGHFLSHLQDAVTRATELQPTNARAFYLLALTCEQNRRWQTQAVNAISRACELEPLNAEYLKLGGERSG